MTVPSHFHEVRQRLALRACHARQATRRAAVAFVLRKGEAGLELLFIRRAEHPHDPWSGHMGLPGGHCEPGDGSAMLTAIRETGEEVGLELHTDNLLGRLDDVIATAHGREVDLVVSPFVFSLPSPQPLVLSSEVVSAHFFSLSILASGSVDSELELAHELGVSTLPAWDIEGRQVWGLTHRMVSSLLARVRLSSDSSGPPP